MAQWGKPLRLRLDNGTPWGTQSPLPSALGLWLVGLDVRPIYGRPRHSTDNGIVERAHGVLAQWVELDRCPDLATCQQRLAQAVQTQRERYRQPNGYTRLAAFPGLTANPRRYVPSQDAQHWRLERVLVYLAEFTFERKVEKTGQISLFANTYAVGRRFARQTLDIRLDPTTREWVFTDDGQHIVARHPARELDYAQISQLQLAKRRRA